MSASKMAIKRLQKEHAAFQKGPPPFIWAKPNESKCVPQTRTLPATAHRQEQDKMVDARDV